MNCFKKISIESLLTLCGLLCIVLSEQIAWGIYRVYVFIGGQPVSVIYADSHPAEQMTVALPILGFVLIFITGLITIARVPKK